MAKLSSIAVAETSDLKLLSADDAPLFYEQDGRQLPTTAKLYGPGSKPYKQAQAKVSNRIGEKFQRKGKFSQSAEEREADQVELLVACTISIVGLEFDGPFEHLASLTGPDLFRAIYSEPGLGFIKDQVQAHIGDWANFTKGSATS